MNIKYFDETLNKQLFIHDNKTKRDICIYELNRCSIGSESSFYPNILIKSNNTIYIPIKETIVSLSSVKRDIVNYNNPIYNIEKRPLFFLIYNTDNYFHFIYDTLPYILAFLYLKKSMPKLGLLMNWSNHQRKNLYPFVIESLSLLGVSSEDICIVNKNTQYEKIFIASSLTYDLNTVIEPLQQIYNLYDFMVKKANSLCTLKKNNPYIYLSRRTWVHNDTSNLGTNYTTRRKLVNEDELVYMLSRFGYMETFLEKFSMIDKIHMLSHAKKVIGAIGGTMCNALFCNPSAKLIILVSPTVMGSHQRFKYCFTGKETVYFSETSHVESGPWKRYMRVQYQNVVGEIETVLENSLIISYADEFVAGWNSEMPLKQKEVPKSQCKPLDNGLNSAWQIDINKLQNIL